MPEYPSADLADIPLETVLKALGDPTRLEIVRMLADGAPLPKNDVWAAFAASKATCSYHFKTLREAGVVVYEVHGRTHDIRLRVNELNLRFPGLLLAVTSGPHR
ncbi:transcriptional regulator [Curtobacterium sp. MCPF17_047]|uniref:ArsR/SmtB family transcription factor n=1 Tax=unclassified Curtobacterium TaxID=257496 RepID=UPI000DA79A83|nr:MULTISPECIES: metalloregulator ArsR/SmtB family transcription factor [unclassified Curtobacterium]PZE60351.1 transcriptional regulator [Curtobacterium sp. MCPF17_001]PZF67819.1 transcriptional regulator [Curtobacterium sp. MCPF17_047]WIB12598.1 metalloregulator ArsR/SmtB family transcription factor [Curtobacterium sp. MCPF17_052]